MCFVRSWNDGPALWLEWKADDSNANLYVTGLNGEQLSRSSWINDKFCIPPGNSQSDQLLLRYDGFVVEPGRSSQWRFVEEPNLAFLQVNAVVAPASDYTSWRSRFSDLERQVYNVEEFCRSASRGYVALCKHCDHIFARSGTVSSIFPAPNMDAVEISENFFCHPKGAVHLSTNGNRHGEDRTRSFLTSSHFFLDLEAHGCAGEVVEGQRTFKCPNCHSELGLFLSKSKSAFLGVKGVLCSFFHGSATLSIRDEVGEQHRFDRYTFSSNEEYLYAWMIRKEFEHLTARQMLLKSFNGRVQMVLWLLDAATIMACGLLDEDGSCPPMAVLKLMFLDRDTDLVSVTTSNAPNVFLSNSVIDFLKLLLLRNQKNLPQALTRIGNFHVSFLRLAQI